jgi:hypothetical protein
MSKATEKDFKTQSFRCLAKTNTVVWIKGYFIFTIKLLRDNLNNTANHVKTCSLNLCRNKCHTKSSRVSTSSAGGSCAASSTSDKKRKSTEIEKQVSPNKKKKETELTGKEIAESIKEGHLAPPCRRPGIAI